MRFGRLRTVAFDGCNSLKVPDTGRNRSWLGRIRYRMGFAGYPTLRLMTLAETGTCGLLGAALGSAADRDEAAVARRLLPLLRPGMLILLDRAFDANALLGEVAATGALLLARAKSTRHPAVLGHLPDGSYLSHLDGLKGPDHRGHPDDYRRRWQPRPRQLPAGHHADGPPPVPGRGRGPALS